MYANALYENSAYHSFTVSKNDQTELFTLKRVKDVSTVYSNTYPEEVYGTGTTFTITDHDREHDWYTNGKPGMPREAFTCKTTDFDFKIFNSSSNEIGKYINPAGESSVLHIDLPQVSSNVKRLIIV